MAVASAAGFVLAGGRSSRMGRDKALLPAGSRTLLEQVAAAVREACGSVTLIGPPGRYALLGMPVVADAISGAGPLGGLYTALRLRRADWNLVAACDMPGLTAEFLRELLDAAILSERDCLVPETGRGLEPLCAVYHARVLPAAEEAVRNGSWKMQDFVRQLNFRPWPVSDPGKLVNVNTPQEWAENR